MRPIARTSWPGLPSATPGTAAPWIEWGDLVGPALAEEALDSLGPEPTKERAWCLSKRAHWHLFDADPAEMLRLAREAVEVAEITGDLGVPSRHPPDVGPGALHGG